MPLICTKPCCSVTSAHFTSVTTNQRRSRWAAWSGHLLVHSGAPLVPEMAPKPALSARWSADVAIRKVRSDYPYVLIAEARIMYYLSISFLSKWPPYLPTLRPGRFVVVPYWFLFLEDGWNRALLEIPFKCLQKVPPDPSGLFLGLYDAFYSLTFSNGPMRPWQNSCFYYQLGRFPRFYIGEYYFILLLYFYLLKLFWSVT